MDRERITRRMGLCFDSVFPIPQTMLRTQPREPSRVSPRIPLHSETGPEAVKNTTKQESTKPKESHRKEREGEDKGFVCVFV